MITRDEDVLSGEPRIDRIRIGVLDVYDNVVVGDGDPASAADALDVSINDISDALAYYEDNPDEMRRVRERRAADRAALKDRAVKPPGEGNE